MQTRPALDLSSPHAAAAIATLDRPELSSLLFETLPYGRHTELDPAVTAALIERVTGLDDTPDELDPPSFVGPSGAAADLVTLLNLVWLTPRELVELHRLVRTRFVRHLCPDPSAPPAPRKTTWSGMRWVNEAFAGQPSLNLDTLASLPINDARSVLHHAKVAGAKPLAPLCPADPDAAFLVCAVAADCFSDATPFHAVLDFVHDSCGTHHPDWATLVGHELAFLGPNPLNAPGVFDQAATARAAVAEHLVAPLAAVLRAGSPAPLAEVAAACAAIVDAH